MHDYLTEETPDYTATTLRVTPNGRLLPATPEKKQKAVFTDSGDEEVNSFADNWFFYQRIPWEVLNDTDKETLLDFYFDAAKANCKEQSFIWAHPTDGYQYVAYFDMDFSWNQTPASIFSVQGVVLKIIGYYAVAGDSLLIGDGGGDSLLIGNAGGDKLIIGGTS